MIKNLFHFDPIPKIEIDRIFYRLSDATFYDRINTIYQFIKSFLDKNALFLRNMEPLKGEVRFTVSAHLQLPKVVF